MKKVLASLILISLLVLPAIAIGVVGQYEVAPEVPVMTALDRIINWLFVILLVVAIIFFIIGAYNFVTAAGDPLKVAAGKQSIMWALVGVVIALLARGLVTLLRTIVGG